MADDSFHGSSQCTRIGMVQESGSIDFSVSNLSTTSENHVPFYRMKNPNPSEPWWKRKKRKMFRKKTLFNLFPILKWLPNYTLQDVIPDLVAGLTVGVTVIPQGLAYGTVAGLPTQYGLYSAYIGCFVYAIFGSTKAVTIGPTSLMALITYETSVVLGIEGAVVLTFLTGLIVLALGLLNLGFLVDFISEPVIGGFSSAAAVSVAVSQIESLLGLSFYADGFVANLVAIFEHIEETSAWDAVIGFASIAALLILRLFDQVKLGKQDKVALWQKVINETCRIMSITRNAIVIVIGTIIAANVTTDENKPFKLTGNITAGLPPFQTPSFFIHRSNETYYFTDICNVLGSSIFVAPLVAVLESVAVAKSVAKGQKVDATQEMIAIGASNLIGSFVSSIPVTGSFSRTAVNSACGVHTALGGIFTGALVLLSITVLTPYFYYIPKSCLAAVIICAVIFMVDVKLVKRVWRSRKLDIIPLFVSFFVCLFLGLEQGIIIGSVVSLAMLLYSTARPKILVQKRITSASEYLLITPDRSIVFPAMDYFASVVRKASAANAGVPVVFNLSYVSLADFSTAYALDHVTRSIKEINGFPVIVSGTHPRVLAVLLGVKPNFEVHPQNMPLELIIQRILNLNKRESNNEISVIQLGVAN